MGFYEFIWRIEVIEIFKRKCLVKLSFWSDAWTIRLKVKLWFNFITCQFGKFLKLKKFLSSHFCIILQILQAEILWERKLFFQKEVFLGEKFGVWKLTKRWAAAPVVISEQALALIYTTLVYINKRKIELDSNCLKISKISHFLYTNRLNPLSVIWSVLQHCQLRWVRVRWPDRWRMAGDSVDQMSELRRAVDFAFVRLTCKRKEKRLFTWFTGLLKIGRSSVD